MAYVITLTSYDSTSVTAHIEDQDTSSPVTDQVVQVKEGTTWGTNPVVGGAMPDANGDVTIAGLIPGREYKLWCSSGTPGPTFTTPAYDYKVPTTAQWQDLATRVKNNAVTVVQTTGTSQTSVMSQDATTKMVFAEDDKKRVSIGGTIGTTTNTPYCVSIGKYATSFGPYNVAIGGGDTTNDIAKAYGDSSIAIGKNSRALASTGYSGHGRHIAIGADSSTGPGTSGVASYDNIAIGTSAQAWSNGSIALGAYSGSAAISTGQMDIGSSNTSYGYNSSNYRLLSGLYDPQTDHDAATKGYVDSVAPVITMTSTDPGEGGSLAANNFIAVYSTQ